MSDDDFAKQIGELMHTEDESVDPRLSRIAAGTLSDEERRALEADAAHDPEIAAALALHEPLSPGVVKKLSATAVLASRPPRRVSLIKRGGLIGGLLAAAIVAGVYLNLMRGDTFDPLPAYRIETHQASEWRSSEAVDTPSLMADQLFAIIVRPASAVEPPVAGALWVMSGETVRRSPISPEISAEGALRWQGAARALSDGLVGPVIFVAVVGRPNALPDAPPRPVTNSGPGYRALKVEKTIRPGSIDDEPDRIPPP